MHVEGLEQLRVATPGVQVGGDLGDAQQGQPSRPAPGSSRRTTSSLAITHQACTCFLHSPMLRDDLLSAAAPLPLLSEHHLSLVGTRLSCIRDHDGHSGHLCCTGASCSLVSG